MRTRTKWQLGILAVLVVAIAVAIGLTAQQKGVTAKPDPSAPTEPAIAADSHRLSEGSTEATLVEFLDFECPSCRQMAPVVTISSRSTASRSPLPFATSRCPVTRTP